MCERGSWESDHWGGSGRSADRSHSRFLETAFFALFSVVLWAVLPVVFFALPASGDSGGREVPFEPGEVLKYEVCWTAIPIGYATLEVLPMESVNGAPAYHFGFTAQTNSFADTFFKVRDRVDAFVDAGFSHSLLFTQKQEEGKRKRNITVTFDWDKAEAQYTNYGKEDHPIPIAPGSFDPLSIFYSFRLHALAAGAWLEAQVTDGQKAVAGRAKVISRQTIRTSDGQEYDTFLVEPDLKDIGGVFKKSKNATLRLWVSADEKHIPVKITSKVLVGSFTAELIPSEGG